MYTVSIHVYTCTTDKCAGCFDTVGMHDVSCSVYSACLSVVLHVQHIYSYIHVRIYLYMMWQYKYKPVYVYMYTYGSHVCIYIYSKWPICVHIYYMYVTWGSIMKHVQCICSWTVVVARVKLNALCMCPHQCTCMYSVHIPSNYLGSFYQLMIIIKLHV